jgi:3-hydroxyisobutyrate dehydrogenase-like beta-hydroxyacid dehydrogenase
LCKGNLHLAVGFRCSASPAAVRLLLMSVSSDHVARESNRKSFRNAQTLWETGTRELLFRSRLVTGRVHDTKDEQVSVQFDVAVLGCGYMGSALARTFAAGKANVTVWNRTPERAQALAASGAAVASNAKEAIEAARIVVVCLSTYESVEAVLADAGTLAGRTVVNMTTGSPDEARPMRDRVAEHGGGYLDAVIVGYPEQVGSDDFLLLVSGREQEWETARPVLALLGGTSRHVSETLEGANVLEAAAVGAFHMTLLTAFTEAARYARSQGVPPKEFLPLAVRVGSVRQFQEDEIARRLADEDFGTDQATLATYEEAARTFQRALSAAGARTPVFDAAVAELGRGVARGRGEDAIWTLAADRDGA